MCSIHFSSWIHLLTCGVIVSCVVQDHTRVHTKRNCWTSCSRAEVTTSWRGRSSTIQRRWLYSSVSHSNRSSKWFVVYSRIFNYYIIHYQLSLPISVAAEPVLPARGSRLCQLRILAGETWLRLHAGWRHNMAEPSTMYAYIMLEAWQSGVY